MTQQKSVQQDDSAAQEELRELRQQLEAATRALDESKSTNAELCQVRAAAPAVGLLGGAQSGRESLGTNPVEGGVCVCYLLGLLGVKVGFAGTVVLALCRQGTTSFIAV